MIKARFVKHALQQRCTSMPKCKHKSWGDLEMDENGSQFGSPSILHDSSKWSGSFVFVLLQDKLHIEDV
jgi:hypothetical protein